MKPVLEQNQKKAISASAIHKRVKEITQNEYRNFLETYDFVIVENIKVPLIII